MSWQVWRQDDNGNRYLVGVYDDEVAARAEADRLEQAGHKQIYWVTGATAPR